MSKDAIGIECSKQTQNERFNDQLLTVLTILLSVLLFVAAPLQANSVLSAPLFGLLFGLVLVPAAFIASGNRTAIISILVALALARSLL
jgi:hypothetical protein